MKNVRYLNGYKLLYMPDHPRCMSNDNWDGYVYEHIVNATSSIGRELRHDEVVHHLDGNRSNNRIENLLVLERSQHVKLHQWLDKGAPIEKLVGEQGMNSVKPVPSAECLICSRTLQAKQKRFCSITCMMEDSSNRIPDKATLSELVALHSREAIGRMYGVTGNAVKKWMKRHGMVIPSRAKRTRLEGVETSGEVKSS